MQCIFDPKMAKTAKTRIFPDTTQQFSDSKQLSPDSDQVLDKSDARFRRKCPKKTIFRLKIAKILENKNFF